MSSARSAAAFSGREMAAAAVAALLLHLVLFALGLPLPHLDLFFYVHPAVELASTGRLAAPALVHHDLTYPLAFYGYPPGFSLILGAWFALFGIGPGSALAYTLTVHAAFVLALYVALRRHVGAGIGASLLATASVFPFFNHGRPDLTALLCAALGLCVAGRASGPGRAAGAGALCGLGLLVSPGYGASALMAVLVWCVLSPEPTPLPRRIARLVLFGAAAMAVFAGGWLATVAQQGAWEFGFSQFNANAATRGRDLNVMPNLASGHALLFTIVPLGALLLPWLVWAALRRPTVAGDSEARSGALAYLAGAGAWFLTSKNFFLIANHLNFLGRPLAQAALTRSSDPRLRLAATVSLVLLTGIVAWREKASLVPRGYWAACREVAGTTIPPGEVWAVDGVLYLPLAARPENRGGRLLSFEEMNFLFYRRTLPHTPASALARLPETARVEPPLPDRIVATPLLSERMTLVDDPRFAREPGSARPGSLDRLTYARVEKR